LLPAGYVALQASLQALPWFDFKKMNADDRLCCRAIAERLGELRNLKARQPRTRFESHKVDANK
jgi:hypothetical protein